MATKSPYYYGGGTASTAYKPPASPSPYYYGGGTAPAAYTPPPAAAPEQQPDSGGGGSPVAQALARNPLETDPGYLAALAAQQAGSQQLDAALKAAQEQAIVRFGDPSLAQALGIQLDPLTAAMAQQNTQAGNSTLAQLQHTRDLNQQSIVNSLAAHGIIRSGDLGYKTGENERGYGTNLYNSQQSLLDSLAGLARDTAAQKQGLRSNTTSAITGAYQTALQNPALWGSVDTGGQQAAANAAAAPPVSPVAQAITQQPQMPGFTAPYKAPTSRLAVKPLASPYSFRSTGRYA